MKNKKLISFEKKDGTYKNPLFSFEYYNVFDNETGKTIGEIKKEIRDESTKCIVRIDIPSGFLGRKYSFSEVTIKKCVDSSMKYVEDKINYFYNNYDDKSLK